MSERFQLPVAIVSVQYQLLGKHVRIWGMSVLYASALVIGFLVMCRMLRPQPVNVVAGYTIYFIAAIQSIFAILGGANAIHLALMRDYQSKMIESHRLTPMTNLSVALGYTFGPTVQIMALLLANITLGSILTALAGSSVSDWLVGNLLLFSGAITIWAMVVCSGMRLAKPISPTPIMVGIGILNIPLMMFPGGGLLCGVYSVIFAGCIMTGKYSVGLEATIAVGAINTVFAMFWLSAAAAKYRRPDLPAMNAARGMLFFVFWLILATFGILAYDYISTNSTRMLLDSGLIDGQWIVTMIVALIIGAFILNGTIVCNMAVRRGTPPRGWGDRVPDILVTSLLAVSICIIMAECGASIWVSWLEVAGILNPSTVISVWGYCLASCLTAMFIVRGWLVTLYARNMKPKYGTLLVFVMFWGGPLGVDVLRAGFESDFQGRPEMSWIFACSPMGTIADIWTDMGLNLFPGMIIQTILAVLLTILAWHTTRRMPRPDAKPINNDTKMD